VLLNRRRDPVIVLDAKSPSEKPADYHYQVSGYALGLNQRHDAKNPVRFAIVSNGLLTLVYPWDSDKPRLRLTFQDFEEDNLAFIELRSLLSYGALDLVQATEDVFEFRRPDMNRLVRIFDECHDLIWKKQKISPTDAFYEFAKLMFVKLREDHRLASLVASGKKPTVSDFNFSVAWIEEQAAKGVDENPVANILFRRVRDELEERIKRKEKKRIFETDETLALWRPTVIEVVRKLEHLDLHGIDEDLNGRMFETFLNATVRGKDLGQFFTPRSVVKYMTTAAGLKATKATLPLIFDGCCGSGGFLIEAMAALVHQIDGMTNLTTAERGALKLRLYEGHLYGVDANDRIARVARLNMYLHGDGGSKIFTADTLDKGLTIDAGLSEERKSDISELRAQIQGQGLRFTHALTNPPFSMTYKKSDQHEGAVLGQYDIAGGRDGALATSVKSNVLFLERYRDLLADDGELLTVIDNTVLNGVESQTFRDFILENFVLRQVVALPPNTFYRAQANVQTSILHLRRRRTGEVQGHVFMAVLNNVGHDDHQRYTPERDNAPELGELFRRWSDDGVTPDVFRKNQGDESLGAPFQVYVVAPDALNTARLDALYYSPDLRRTRTAIRRQVDAGAVELLNVDGLEIVPPMTKDEAEEATGTVYRYFEIGDVTPAGAIITWREEPFEALPGRARMRVKTNDVIFAKHRNSRGTAVIIPPEFNGQLVTTGFMAIRPKTYDEALLLWSVFTSETFKKQVYYLAVTAVQPEIRDEIFKREFLLPVPRRDRDRRILIQHARRVRELYEESRQALRETSLAASRIFEGDGP
jgi:type I restriction enzyme M protein